MEPKERIENGVQLLKYFLFRLKEEEQHKEEATVVSPSVQTEG